ncbi:MAG: N-acetyltransferase [Prevotellaceae bacterium]|nr:N-acetyltransferase [Prevotellaceae bacterium]
MNIQLDIRPIHTKKEIRDFAHFGNHLYCGNNCWVPDIESDLRALFKPKTADGDEAVVIQGFGAYRGNEMVGRILGIVNHRANKKWKTHTVRFGIFDFIDDLAVSKGLLDAVAEWGRQQGLDNIQGPLGATDFDKEGMLMENFDMLGSMSMYYNAAYYPQHMQQLGYEKAVDWLSIHLNIPKELPQRYIKTAGIVKKMLKVHVRYLTASEVNDGWGEKVFNLLNEAYAPLYGFSAFTREQAQHFISAYLPLLNMKMMPVVVDEHDNIVCLAITMGSLSHALRKSKGRLWPFGWFHLLKALKLKHEDTVEMLLIGVKPELQGIGLTSLVFLELIKTYNDLGYKYAITGPQLETNVKELSQWKYLNPELVMRRRCWKKPL